VDPTQYQHEQHYQEQPEFQPGYQYQEGSEYHQGYQAQFHEPPQQQQYEQHPQQQQPEQHPQQHVEAVMEDEDGGFPGGLTTCLFYRTSVNMWKPSFGTIK